MKIQKSPKKSERTDILGLDEMCVDLKRIWLWIAVNIKIEKLVGFFADVRSFKSFKELCKTISHIEAKFHLADKFPIYNIIPPNEHLIGKSHTYTVARIIS